MTAIEIGVREQTAICASLDIDAVAVGGTVNVAVGTYNEVVTITESLTLAGADQGPVDPILDGTGMSSSAAGITIAAHGVTISGLTIQDFSGTGGIEVMSGGVATLTVECVEQVYPVIEHTYRASTGAMGRLGFHRIKRKRPGNGLRDDRVRVLVVGISGI